MYDDCLRSLAALILGTRRIDAQGALFGTYVQVWRICFSMSTSLASLHHVHVILSAGCGAFWEIPTGWKVVGAGTF